MGAGFMKKRPRTIKLAEITLASGGATSGNTITDPIDVAAFKEGTFFLRHTAMVGTTKTLDVAILTKDPSGANWLELENFTQSTGASAATAKKGVEANMGDTLAISWEKGSANIVTTFTVYGVFK